MVTTYKLDDFQQISSADDLCKIFVGLDHMQDLPCLTLMEYLKGFFEKKISIF